jgi:type I restriction enzyme, S subunit
MSEWKLTKLNEFANINPRRSVKKGAVVPFIAMTELVEGARDIPNKSEKAFGSGTKFIDGDTLFARITPCLENGKTSLVSGLGDNVIGAGSTEFIVLNPKNLNTDKNFIYYLARLPELRAYAEKKMEGTSGRQRVSAQALGEFEFMLPPPNIRKCIGQFLANLDDKIDANTLMNQTLEKIAQRIFKSWFIDFDPVKANAEGVPFADLSPEIQSLFPSEFVESEIGLIPKGWEVKSLDELFDVGIGKTPPRKQTEWFSKNHSDMTWVSIKDMGESGVYNIGSSEYLVNEAVDKFNVRLIPADTVLMSFKLTVGRLSITSSECTTNEAIAHFKQCGKTSMSSPQLYLSLRSINFDSYGSTSSIATAINSKIVKKIKVLVPTENINIAFSEIINPVFEKIKSNQLESETLQKIRDRLLPKLLSGSIEINDDIEEQIAEAS